MAFLRCMCYLALSGAGLFLLGRILPKGWFQPKRFPYRSRKHEEKLFKKLKVKKWQNKLPDMSKILPRWMPPKHLLGNYKERLQLMIQETCIAEFIHKLCAVSGLYCLKIWPGAGGCVVVSIHVMLLNLPYILIQRFNRPRLMALKEKLHT